MVHSHIAPFRAACQSSDTLLDASLDASHQHVRLHLLVLHLFVAIMNISFETMSKLELLRRQKKGC